MCFGYGKVREGRKDVPSLLLVQATRAIGDLLAGAGVDVVSCLLGDETECCSHVNNQQVILGDINDCQFRSS